MSPRPFFVIGNGPSLRGFDFHRLKNFETLGMNAAYRHWDRIKWYPTHYCCLDTELIITHHNEIKRLVVEGQVRSAFVAGNFFELHPELRADARFMSFDQVHPYWHRNRGQKMGLPFVDHPAFKTSDTSKVTTGAFSVRYGAYLGYDLIALLGIDLKYVEVIEEAEHGDGIALVMKSTPKHNPNYFFDDYQQAGDRYNIPNPSQHGGELHPISFQVMRDDFQNNDVPSRVVNCSPKSMLQQMGVLPYLALDRMLDETSFGSIAVPCNMMELDQIVANVRLWAQPGFAPYLTPIPAKKPSLVFVFNNDDGKAAVKQISEVVEATNLKRFFDKIEFKFLDLRGEHDAYIRRYDKPVGPSGYKAGPNNQFFATMRAVKDYGRYTFLMETDCVPIRPDWLRELTRVVGESEPFWIMGSAYRGIDQIAQKFGRHINGNAIYAAGDPDFQAFCDDYWRPGLLDMVDKKDRTLAYDCALEVMLGEARSDVSGDATWRRWQGSAHLFRYSAFIQNVSAKKDLTTVEPTMVRDILQTSPQTLIIHSQVLAVAARELLDAPASIEAGALKPRPKNASSNGGASGTEGFKPLGATPAPSVTKKDKSFLIPPGPDKNYVALRFAGVVKTGDKLKSVVGLYAEEDCQLSIELCRDGNSAWESARYIKNVKKGESSIAVEHRFRKQHAGARIQIGAVEKAALVEIVDSAISTAT